jgi:peptidylprolyl isomerase
MKTAILSLPLLAAASVMPLAAQTTPHTTTSATHTATTTAVHHTAIRPTCITLPEISSKIPALPADLPCAKALYTLTRVPDIKVDYISPLVSPEVRESIDLKPATFSLAYVDVLQGTGALVKSGKFLTVKYTGYLANGTKFDSSEDHPGKEPLTFQYGMHKVIEGWDTGYEGMRVGGKRRIFIPYQLAYGEAGRQIIPAKAELVFDMEVVAQGDTEPKPPAPPARPAPQALPQTKPATPSPASSTTPPASDTKK